NVVDRDGVAVGGAGPSRRRLKPGLGRLCPGRAARWRARSPARERARAAEDGSAVLLSLVSAVGAAGDGTHTSTDERALARALAAVGERTTGGAEGGAQEAADPTRLGDTPGAITTACTVRGDARRHRRGARRIHDG